jgi:alpha-tubulin suppressor-like RCC1 family protein
VVGQLGNGIPSFSAQPVPVLGITGAEAIAATNDHTCIVTGTGNAFCWGANNSGQLGANPAQYPNSSIPIDVTAARPINATPGTPQAFLTLVGGVRPVLLPMVSRR